MISYKRKLEIENVCQAAFISFVGTMLNPKRRGENFTWSKLTEIAEQKGALQAKLNSTTSDPNKLASEVLHGRVFSANLAKRFLEESELKN